MTIRQIAEMTAKKPNPLKKGHQGFEWRFFFCLPVSNRRESLAFTTHVVRFWSEDAVVAQLLNRARTNQGQETAKMGVYMSGSMPMA